MRFPLEFAQQTDLPNAHSLVERARTKSTPGTGFLKKWLRKFGFKKISRLGASLGYFSYQPGLAPKRLIRKLGCDKALAAATTKKASRLSSQGFFVFYQFLVEAAGIEPASRNVSMSASTCVAVCLLSF
jgi:hypothetical protein